LAREREDEPLRPGLPIATEIVVKALSRLERPLDRPAEEVRTLEACRIAAELSAVLVE
jgi:hypothetical protein